MRGCLLGLTLLAGLALAATWLALPPLMGTLAEGALAAAGFNGTGTSVEVVADPPPKLLTLRADAIRIHSTNVTYRDLQAADVNVTLRDVRLLDRTFGSLDGTLRGVLVRSVEGARLSVPLVTLSGTDAGARATMTIPAADVEALAASALEGAIGITPTGVVVASPDRVRIEAGSLTINGRLAVRDDGSLVLVPPDGSDLSAVTLVAGGPDAPFRILSFRVADGGLDLVAEIDLPGG